jgi:hypothetical protein
MAQSPQTRPGIDQVLGRLDRRIVYAGLVLVTLIPLVGKVSLPMYPTDPPKKLMQTIDELPTDRVVLIGSNWDAGTQAESRPQLVAVVRHLIRRGIKFAVFTVSSPNGPTLANTAIEQAIASENQTGAWKYGENWCILGYKFADDPWVRTFASSVNAAWKQDWQGTPLSDIPMMKGVDKFGPDGQISMLMDITGTASVESWYQFMSPTRVKIGLGCTAVMAPEQYNYLDSGQLSGLLTGMKGAAEYEQLTNTKASGTAMMAGQSFAHLYILILIILGNLSILAAHLRRTRRTPSGGAQ